MSQRPDPEEVFDEGLQQERTGLAWDRTSLSMIVAGLVLMRNPSSVIPLLPMTVGGVIVVTGTWLGLVSYLRYRRLHRVLRDDRTPASPWLIRWVGASTVALAIAALVELVSMGS